MEVVVWVGGRHVFTRGKKNHTQQREKGAEQATGKEGRLDGEEEEEEGLHGT